MDKSFKRSSFFNLLVVGDNPDELIKKYDKNNKVERYIKYKYRDADKMRKNAIKLLEGIMSNTDKLNMEDFTIETIKAKLQQLNNMTSFQYYLSITQGMFYDDNGDAMSEDNPDGKFDSAKIGANYAVPFTLKEGTESFSAKVGDIDWSKMHLNEDAMKTYSNAWELVVDGREPTTNDEETIANAMGDKTKYFERFASKEDYVSYSCSFWQYAILTKDGWQSMEGKSSSEWISTFYDKFIKPLDENTLLTIYECSVK